jgi:hypothetical protein
MLPKLKRGCGMLKRLWVGLLLLVVVGAMNVVPAAAQDNGQGLEISPPLIELKTDPGKTVQITIRLRNITKGPLIAKPQIHDFIAQGEDGQPKLLLDDNAPPSAYTLKSWIQPIAEITIAPQEIKTLTTTLVVPKNASPGGHYGVIHFTAIQPGLEGTGVSLSASIGSLILLNVSGNVNQKLNIKEFYTSQNGHKKSFFEKSPISFTEKLSNEGNIHEKPTGTLRVTNMLGREVAVLSINQLGGNVLPGSTRRFDQQLNKPRLFGRYTVQADIQYAGNPLRSTLTFWVIPYKLIAITLGLIIIAVAAILIGLKRYKRSILKRHTGNSSRKDIE